MGKQRGGGGGERWGTHRTPAYGTPSGWHAGRTRVSVHGSCTVPRAGQGRAPGCRCEPMSREQKQVLTAASSVLL